jgi:hypothetical protein
MLTHRLAAFRNALRPMTILITALSVAMVWLTPPANARPSFCEPVVYASIWNAYQVYPPPPAPFTLNQARTRSNRYEQQAINRMKRAGLMALARDYKAANSRANSLSDFRKAMQAVYRSGKEIEMLCGFDPYKYEIVIKAYPYPPRDVIFR